MEFRITHGPVVPQNDLQFVKAGTLQVTSQTIVFSGKWRMMKPGKVTLPGVIMTLLLLAAISVKYWVPQAWQAGTGEAIIEISKTILLLAYGAYSILQTMPLTKKIIADRDALREIVRTGREITFLFRDQKGRERRAFFNTDTEEEAAAIETALRMGTEQTFTITYGFATPRPIMPVPGQIVIRPQNVHLSGYLPRNPYPDWRIMLPVTLLLVVFFIAMVVVGLVVMVNSVSWDSPISPFTVYSGVFIAGIILFMFGAIIYGTRRMRMADVPKAAITEIRQQGQEVSFRAPLEGNHGVSGVTTVLQAVNPEQAAAIARALAVSTESSMPYTVNYGAQHDVNTLCLVGNGRMSVGPEVVQITGRRNAVNLSLNASIGLFALMFVPFIIAYAVTWLALHDGYLALFISMPALFIVSIVTAWPHRVTIPRKDITGVERDGRQLTLRARMAGREEQAVFHTRSEEEAVAISLALG